MEKVGSASAIIHSSITKEEDCIKLVWFQGTPLRERCSILLLVSSLTAASSVVLDCLSLLVLFGDAAEPIKHLTERMSQAHLMPC